MPLSPTDQAHINANNAEVQAEQERLWELQQQSLEQQRADMVEGFYSQLGLHKAGQEAENALMFLGEWQKTVNKHSEQLAYAQFNGLPPPPEPTGVTYGSLFNNTAEDNEDNMDALGNTIGGGFGG